MPVCEYFPGADYRHTPDGPTREAVIFVIELKKKKQPMSCLNFHDMNMKQIFQAVRQSYDSYYRLTSRQLVDDPVLVSPP